MQKRLHRKVTNRILNGTDCHKEIILKLNDAGNQLYVDQRGYQWKLESIGKDQVKFKCSCLFCNEFITAVARKSNNKQIDSKSQKVYKTKGHFMHHYHKPIAEENFGIRNNNLKSKNNDDIDSELDANETTKETLELEFSQDKYDLSRYEYSSGESSLNYHGSVESSGQSDHERIYESQLQAEDNKEHSQSSNFLIINRASNNPQTEIQRLIK